MAAEKVEESGATEVGLSGRARSTRHRRQTEPAQAGVSAQNIQSDDGHAEILTAFSVGSRST
jgi:hypothetical protein